MRRLLLLSFIWGWSFLFIKVAVEGMPPPAVAWGRVTLGAAVLVAVLVARRQSVPLDRPHLRHFAVAALFANVLPFTMLAWGEERITSALTAVLNASTPLFTAVLAALYLHDRLRPKQVVGLLLGFAGVATAAGFQQGDVAQSSLLGSLAAVGAGLCYGIAFTYMRKHLIAVPATVAAAGQLVVASLLLLPFAVATTATSGLDLTPNRIVSIVLLGALGTGVAYILNYRVIADLGATRASLVTYVIPVVAVTVGIVVLGEPFEVQIVAGGVVIALGITLVHDRVRFPRRRPPRAAVPSAAAAVVLVLVAVASFTGCSSNSNSSSACRASAKEAINPDERHVFPNAPEPNYTTDPPTSGPHVPGAAASGTRSEPLTRPEQVGALEAGAVLLQYRDLDPDELAQLSTLASATVAVAPNPSLPDRVVATAWLEKQVCTRVDVATLRGFVVDHAGHGPGQDR